MLKGVSTLFLKCTCLKIEELVLCFETLDEKKKHFKGTNSYEAMCCMFVQTMIFFSDVCLVLDKSTHVNTFLETENDISHTHAQF